MRIFVLLVLLFSTIFGERIIGGELTFIHGPGGLPTQLVKDGKQWLSAPVTLTLKNETAGTTAAVKTDGTCPEFGIVVKSNWKKENDWLVWSLDFQGTEKPSGYTMVFEFPVLKGADQLFTPSEKGVVDLQLTPTFAPVPYGRRVYGYRSSYVLPLASPFDSKQDTGLTIALAPDENIPHLQVDWKDGTVLRFTLRHRGIGQGRTSTLKFLFTAHPADERSVIGTYAKRYSEWFEPVMPSGVLDGSYWYHHILRRPDSQELKRHNMRAIWTSLWFTHLGEYLPDATEWNPYTYPENSMYPIPGEGMSDALINRFIDEMHTEDIKVFAYFNVTEYGGKGEDGDWARAAQILREQFADAIIKREDGSTIQTWEGAVAMNAGEQYALWPFLEEQIKRHFHRLPNIDGFAIDRLDWASVLDYAHDDGLTMVGEKTAENLALVVAGAVERLSALTHEKNKRVYVNQFTRIEPVKNTDGYWHEWDFMSIGYLSPFKPIAAWFGQHPYFGPDYSVHEANLKKRLQIALFPHLIASEFPVIQQAPHPIASDCNAMFAPLFAPFVGKRQVLLPHPIAVTGANDSNLFTDINGNWLVPITSRTRFLTKGDRSTEQVIVTLNVPDANEAKWAHAIPVVAPPYKAPLVIEGGKAVVTLPTHGSATMLLIGKGEEPALPKTDHERLLEVCNARFPERLPVEPKKIPSPDFAGRKIRSATLSISGRHHMHAAPLQVALNGKVVGMITTAFDFQSDTTWVSKAGHHVPYALSTSIPTVAAFFNIDVTDGFPSFDNHNGKPLVTVTSSDQGSWWLPDKARLNLVMDDQTMYSAIWTPETASLTGTNKVLNIELQWRDKPFLVSTAEFLGTDLQRRGQWQGHFGKSAVLLAGNAAPPTSTGIAIDRGQEFTWRSNRNDPRILEGAAQGASCWYDAESLFIEFVPESDTPYRLTIYCLDYDRTGRPLRITVTDGFGKVLDTRRLSAEETQAGVYCTWKGTGQIQVLVELDEGAAANANVTVSGVFIDPVE